MPRSTVALAALSFALAACGNVQEADLTSATQAEIEASAAEIAASEDINLVYADFLADYVMPKDGINFVAYGKVTEDDHNALRAYISALETQGVEGLSEDEEMAFWFNLYNAKTIDIILENYPLDSIRSLGSFNRGPWDRKVLDVVGFGEMSLNDVEHGTLRANWDEPRIHYAVNCASFGCPNLKATPWRAETLEEDLDAAAVAYINHPRGISVETGRVTASSIFNWYKEDFGGNNASILEHARQYASDDLLAELDGVTSIANFDYDWTLNEPS